METLYERLGGDKPIIALCRLLLRKAEEDARVSKFFEDVDYEGQCVKLSNYFIMGLGGPDNYSETGNGMHEGHRRLREELGLNDTHFDVILELGKDSMVELGVPEKIQEELATILESNREQVLGRAE